MYPTQPTQTKSHGATVRLLSLARRATALVLACSILSPATWANPKAAEANKHPCSAHALKRAKPLLRLHTDGDDRAEVDNKVYTLPPIANPANPKQTFDVLGVTGWVYKGEYRLRFIYARISGECILMGQEILERSSL